MSPVISNLLLKSTAETFYMLGVSALIAAVVGIPLGILLVVTEKNGILACRLLNKPLAFVINMIRSIPFIILMVAIIPLTRLIAGTSIGTTAAIVPLTIAAIPYTARMVETSIREVPFGSSKRPNPWVLPRSRSLRKSSSRKPCLPSSRISPSSSSPSSVLPLWQAPSAAAA